MKTILSSNPSQLLEMYQQIKDDRKIHPTHYVRTRLHLRYKGVSIEQTLTGLYLRLLDSAVMSEDVDTLEAAGECGTSLVTVLRTLEGGEGKLTRK